SSIVRSLQRDLDYEVEEDKRVVVPLEAGIEKVERALGVDNLYDDVSSNLVHQFQVALKAKELYKRDKDYIVQGGEVKIVDEFTGRILEGRRWSEGIHQAVEAKEGVKIKEENQTLATITLQNYFRMYDKLAGMTGTASTEAAELMNTYGLGVVPVPTNRPVARLDQADLIYRGEPGKFSAVIEDIAERHEKGQPVLVGTVSVEKSELLSRMMRQHGIAHEVLNAKQHTREAEIVAQAGRLGAVTVATNMAGRGVDIQLGGNPDLLAHYEVLKEGYSPDLLVDDFALPRPLAEMPDDFREERAKAQARFAEHLAVFKAQCRAEGEQVRALGGLYVVGSERHDSRRIDNQLRGRSGRQGDPGESRFYLSLDDELMRLFATGALQWAMGRFDDDEAIEAKMVTKAIERAQTTVETKNAEIRKNVLKYDEVMNEQRKVIYKRRDQILEGEDLKSAGLEYLADAVDALIDAHCQSVATDEWDLDGLSKELTTFWPTTLTSTDLAECATSEQLYEVVMAEAMNHYESREAEMGEEVMREVERQVMLRIIDQRWREHLEEMDYLKEGINLRAMGQKDPLTEWQREGFEMFGAMMKGIAQDFVRYVMHVQVAEQEQPKLEPKVLNLRTSSSDDIGQQSGFSAAAAANEAGPPAGPAPAASKPRTVTKDAFDKTPRNAPCPCGSGKKFKQCHGAD
ncbi:MAG: preprotein translocase subunit SecA, partial [Ilumatobacteraceae bacterium]